MSSGPALRLKPLVDTGSFARYAPFGDRRELIVRRGRELGQDYGLPLGQRVLEIEGNTWVLSRYRALLSPPPLQPGALPMSPEQARAYVPESEVVRTGQLEVLIPREPHGFDESEVRAILTNLGQLEAGQPKQTPRSEDDALFATHRDPNSEVRRCGSCGEPAMVCRKVVTHAVRGVAAGWVVRHYVCERCGGKVKLVDPKRIRALKLTAWIMVWAIIPTPILLFIAYWRRRAWVRHPLVRR